MAQNPALRAGHERLRELSAAVREKADYHAAPARFKVRSQKPRAWLLAPAFALVLAAGIALGVFLAQPRDDDSLGAARLDYLDGHSVAALVYRRRQHVIDVFVWPGRDTPHSASARDGFNVVRFGSGGMRYWIVSDLNRNELADFARLLAR